MRFAECVRDGLRAGQRIPPSSGLWALLVVVLVVLGWLLPLYWVYLLSSVAVSAMIARGVGLVTNRVGIITLCQMSFAAIGGWVVSWLALHWPELPFPLLVVVAGIATAPIGLLLGLATSRIRGVELAVLTLGFAGALDLVLRQWSFPGVGRGVPVLPAAPFDDPRCFFALAWALLIVLQLALWAVGRTPHGLGWRAVGASERAAAALGVRTWWSKATAFGAGALFAGVAGGMLAGQYGLLTTSVFTPLTSMVHLATAVLCGAALFSGALLAGVFAVFVPEALRRVGLPLDVGNALLALGAFDVLRRGTGGIAELLHAKLQDRAFRGVRTTCEPIDNRGIGNAVGPGGTGAGGTRTTPPESDVPPLEIKGMTVVFGGTPALDDVDLVVREAEVLALIGPNGAGKSTLVDGISGFLSDTAGTVRLDGVPLDGTPAHLRARRGIRRTFQHSRGISAATVGDFIRLAAPAAATEHRESVRRYFGLPEVVVPTRLLDVGTRRMLEIAGALAAGPRVLLLDEPAAGLGEAERTSLAARLRGIPARFGCSVLLVEHDMEFVRAAAERLAVLEAGRIIASGSDSGSVVDTMALPQVIDAYLGREAVR
ncbi:branched-chain amino acid ABC transporter ATP-binding protein/permease [Microbacterium sp. A93]|uniref:branched-chain amino acid ABC transporter ATP-binding protein/permease n=1 Tax=Microbacterium sp. A93 TaxID=3450716 RepID=UPI003F42A576